jgi:hypothetical protein
MYKNGTLAASSTQQMYFGNVIGDCFGYDVTNNTPSTNFVISYPLCADGTTQNISLPPGTTVPICSRSYPIVRRSSGDPASPSEVTVLNVLTPCDTYTVSVGTTQNVNFNIDKGTNNTDYISLTGGTGLTGDKLYFQLRLLGISSYNYTASLTPSNLSVGSLALSTGYSVTNCPYITGSTSTSITFTNSLSNFYNGGYLFTPNPVSGSKNSLYGTYFDVDYTFDPKENDIVVLHLSDSSVLEYVISKLSVNPTTNELTLHFNEELSLSTIYDLTNNNYRRFLLLSRRKDETNVVLNFVRRNGKSSNGFLIPENISQTVLNNIDVITKEVKQKILGDQPIINDLNGGTFP